VLVRGSRGPDVVRAQQLLNRFLRRLSTGSVRDCVGHDSPRRSTSLAQEHRQLLTALHQRGQLPLKLDGILGRSTEQTVRHFQNCRGLVPDGKIGPVTWDYLERQPGTRPPRRRPEPHSCGLPERPAAELEQELDLESEMLNEARRRHGSAVLPRLSFFLNASSSTARNHFQCQASRVARRLGALAVGRDDPCTTRRVGPTSYDTGADIVGAISSAHTCLNHKIGVIHVFGHSGSGAIYGPNFLKTEGLYTTVSTADRAAGAREISDIPASALVNDVVVVLHGCNQGADTDSFAEQLYRHLRATLTAPVVLAHYNTGCAGRDNSWIRFDNRTPTGRRVRSVAPYYSGDGCCSPAPRRRRAASHAAVG
jgi:Putative peptidoglycan binding domain